MKITVVPLEQYLWIENLELPFHSTDKDVKQRHADNMRYMVEYILNNITPYVYEEEGIDYYFHLDRSYGKASFLPQLTLSGANRESLRYWCGIM